MPQHQGTTAPEMSSVPPLQPAAQHQPVHYGTPSSASLAPATTKEYYNPMRHTQQSDCVATRRVPESGLIQARRAAYATHNESQQPLSQGKIFSCSTELDCNLACMDISLIFILGT